MHNEKLCVLSLEVCINARYTHTHHYHLLKYKNKVTLPNGRPVFQFLTTGYERYERGHKM